MQIKEIAELIEIIERSAIEEFELERSGVRIRVRKSGRLIPAPNSGSGGETEAVAESSARSAPPAAPPAEPAQDPSVSAFKAPIVGTVYLSPKPDAEPFVKVGDRVEVGTVLCIIEAMKIFNQIESDVAGVISRILVKNGQPVEYGEALFEIGADA